MTAKANPLAVDQGATEKELTGSESNSQDQSTPGGISSASDNNVDADEGGTTKPTLHVVKPADDPKQALLTVGAFATWVAQTYCDEVAAMDERPDDETLVRDLLERTNEKMVWANGIRRPPYKEFRLQTTITPSQVRVMNKALDIELDPNVVMGVTTTDEPDERPESPSVEDRDAQSGAEQVAEEVAAKLLDSGEKLNSGSLVTVILSRYTPGVTVEGSPYVVPRDPREPKVTVNVESLFDELVDLLNDKGVDATDASINRAIAVVRAKARKTEPSKLALRCHQDNESVTVDLGRRDGAMVRITADGWRVLSPDKPEVSHIRWSRTSGDVPLPEPERGGSREELAQHMGLAPDSREFKLSYGWLVASFFANLKRPILWNVGVMGSAKTGRAVTLLRLVEGRDELGMTLSGSVDNDVTTARSEFIPSYDNIGNVTPSMSDFLCVLVTGGKFSKRKQYSNGDVFSMKFTRSAIATSITRPYGLGADAMERIVFVDYERMPDENRRTEAALAREFEDIRARIAGALYDDVAAVLGRLAVKQAQAEARMFAVPRMADYAVVLHALDEHLGLSGDDSYAQTYWDHVKQNMADRADSDPLVAALLKVVPKSGNTWTGTATNLFNAISVFRPADSKAPWPSAANHLSNILNVKSEVLRSVGIEVTKGHAGSGRTTARQITLRNMSEVVAEEAEDDELLALAQAHADGYRGHLVELGDVQLGVLVHSDGEGGYRLTQGGTLDPSKWDAQARTYNGHPARSWLEVDDRFKAL